MSHYPPCNSVDEFIGKHTGTRGFVIGGGSSIGTLLEEGFDPSLLDSEITIGANKAYKFCALDYFTTIDPTFVRNFYEEINVLTCPKFIPVKYSQEYLVEPVYKIPMNSSFRNMRAEVPTSFSTMVYEGGSGTFAIRAAYLLGLNPIYLVGMDCTTSEKRSHFHDDYSSQQTENHVRIFYRQQELLIRNICKKIDIYSCSPISKLNSIIPYVPMQELFDATNT